MKSGKMLEIQTIFDKDDQDFDLYRLFLGSQQCPIDRKTAKSPTMVENTNLYKPCTNSTDHPSPFDWSVGSLISCLVT